MSIKDFNLDLPFPDIFLDSWGEEIGPRDFMCFRNLDHFRHEMTQITQKSDDMCNMSYKDALNMLLMGKTDFPKEEQESIRNLVRSNLHKRGLITEEVYENFRYSSDGTKVDVDVGKYAAGEPDCVMSPAKQYVDFFYELYVSISYPWNVQNEEVRKNIAKLLATVEELERQHIFIKITLILPIRGACHGRDRSNFFSSIPLFSHKDRKSVATMSAVVNDRLLRKFYFAVLENLYTDNLNDYYGYPMEMESAMNVGSEFDEIKFFTEVQECVGAV